MGTFLSERELGELTAPDNTAFPSPIPLQMVSNGEFNPLPQTEQQRKVEGRLKELADQHGPQARLGPSAVFALHLRHGGCICGDE